ncbi:MAG: S8 family peptidase [Alphaproteobacteria bacterium]
MTKYFVRFGEIETASEALSFFNERPKSTQPQRSKTDPTLAIAELDDHDVVVMRERGAQVYEDIQFSVVPPTQDRSETGTRAAEFWRMPTDRSALMAPTKSLDDVLDHVRAPEAWAYSRGGGTTIAIVDTGICGSLMEFPQNKRSSIDLDTAFTGQHWSDIKGHGSMCATIAAGSKALGGRFDGVAPDATVLAARTTLSATDIYAIYDELIDAKRVGRIDGPLIISNSYGLYTCSPPSTLPQDHPYMNIVLTALDEGAVVVFAAGNNHYDVLCGHDPQACEPNTIWAANSHDRVLSIGTVNENESNRDPATPHSNSSRGPGEWAQDLPKPDCVAPTYGRVVWGCGYRIMDWWGTSGACPQVAGLAALILSVNPRLTPRRVGDIIRETCRPLEDAPSCVGHGIIDCEAAVKVALSTA